MEFVSLLIRKCDTKYHVYNQPVAQSIKQVELIEQQITAHKSSMDVLL